ncbi:MAG: outer membrane protein assembly factor BamA [Planctomycetota bacterium]
MAAHCVSCIGRSALAGSVVCALACVLAAPAAALGQLDPTQDEDVTGPIVAFADRPVSGVVLRRPEGDGFTALDPVLERTVLNQIRTRTGTALDPATLLRDRRTLDRLGRFERIVVEALPQGDGSIVVIFTLDPQPLVQAVQPIGNRQLSEQDIGRLASKLLLNPIDPVQIQNVARDIEKAYELLGYFQAQVTPDFGEVEETGILYFRIREGDRLRVTGVRFNGNAVFSDRKLRSQIETSVYSPILDRGRFDEARVEADVQALLAFYRDRGYVDVRADWQRIDAPNNREVIVVFQIAEGERYTVRDILVDYADAADPEFAPRLSPDQVRGLMSIKTGDVYNASLITESVEDLYAALAKLGYTLTEVAVEDLSDAQRSVVDLRVAIRQGTPSRVGLVTVIGNDITKTRVVLRFVELEPDTPADIHERRRIEDSDGDRTQQQLERSRFFGPLGRPDVRVVLQPERVPGDPYRDVLISVQETRTGQFNFGAAVSSDTGVFGQISLVETNFDITDVPESVDELLARRAFRGGGQTLALRVEPGNERQEYSLRFTEPFLLETNTSFSAETFIRTRDFDDFDRQRIGAGVGVGRRFGQRWQGTLSLSGEQVTINDIPPDRPVDIFEAGGTSVLDSIGVSVSRSTLNDPFLPTRGTRISLGADQAGALGGDWEFTRLTARGVVYVPIREDFLGRATVANFSSRLGYIPQSTSAVPVFERFNTGGAAFRGFDVRGIGPVGIQNDTGELGGDQVGGNWELFFGVEIQQPFINENLRLVAFVDSGTILEEPGLQDYRVSVGFGFRVIIPQLTPVPLAFDFGFPIRDEPEDDERLFTFTVEVPF